MHVPKMNALTSMNILMKKSSNDSNTEVRITFFFCPLCSNIEKQSVVVLSQACAILSAFVRGKRKKWHAIHALTARKKSNNKTGPSGDI